MIPLHYLWSKLNNRTRGQFECDVTWFCFYFEFVRSHVRCRCCPIVCWRERERKRERGGRIRLKLDVQGHGDGTVLDLDGQAGCTSYVYRP